MSIKNTANSKQRAEYETAIRTELAASSGNVRSAAHQLGVSREWVRRWVKRLGIDLEKYRRPRSFKVLIDGRVIGSVTASSSEKAADLAVREYHVTRVELASLLVVEDLGRHGD